MIIEILLTVWLSIIFLGIIFLIIGELSIKYEIAYRMNCIGRVICWFWGIATLLIVFSFAIYLVWS